MELTYIKKVIIIIITFADGNWTRWSPWSQCSRRCGGGVQTRSRSCTNPQPAFGGSYCDGRSLEKRPCNSQECWGTHITVLPNLLMIMLLFSRANNGCCQGWPGRGAWHELVVFPLSYSLIITRLVFPLRWPLVIKNWSFNYCVCLTPESYPIQRRRQKFPTTMVCDKTNSLFLLAEWPRFPEDFNFGPKIRPNQDENCLRIFERRDYHTWKNYLFCTPGDRRQLGMRWSDQEPIAKMRCTHIYVQEDSRGNKWNNNFLCVPRNSAMPYRWDLQ